MGRDTQLSGREQASVSLRFLSCNVVVDALQDPWLPSLSHTLVCHPLARERSSCMKRRSDVETSFLNLETWRRLSQAKCICQSLVFTLDFKQFIINIVYNHLLTKINWQIVLINQ